MRLGYRFFLVLGDEVIHLYRKIHKNVFSKKLPVFRESSGKIIDIALAIYQSEDRKPSRLIRIGCSRYKITKRGALDAGYQKEFRKHISYKLAGAGHTAQVRTT